MPLSKPQKQKISIEVIKTLVTRFESFPEDASNNRNAPFHEAFLNAFSDKLQGKVSDVPFFISLSSWLQGLNTTLGQTFFENVAHILCNGEKREYTSKKLGNSAITQKQKDVVNRIITDLSTSTVLPNLVNENALLYQAYNSPLVNAIDFSADVFFEDANSVTAIELKSVRPNSGEMRGEKMKILEGKAALYRLFPNKDIHFYIGFPFDPTVNPTKENVTGYDKTRFLGSIINMSKYFDSKETLIAGELWDFLSGMKNTMEEILEIINAISTVDFLKKYQLLKDNTMRNTSEYDMQLQEWNLFSEISIVDNNSAIQANLNTAPLTRIFNKTIFDSKGDYNWDRYNTLKAFI
ncbi:MAG: TdeIII family type II restriction endonuclease [Tannerella sp.]|jgi:hypothetical protein|nr:TdeIII family type II restriction endonuclease [Tannerella sp.]